MDWCVFLISTEFPFLNYFISNCYFTHPWMRFSSNSRSAVVDPIYFLKKKSLVLSICKIFTLVALFLSVTNKTRRFKGEKKIRRFIKKVERNGF